MNRIRLLGGLVGSALLLAAHDGAANTTYYVDQKHPAASDATNCPGTEAVPFKTIQAALDKAGPADTVWVKAGVYRETAVFKRGGELGRYSGTGWMASGPRIVLSGYADDEAVIDGSDVVSAGAWQPVAGKRNVYAAHVAVQTGAGGISGGVPLVYWRGQRLARCWQQSGTGWTGVVPGPEDANRWWYDCGGTNLYVNLGGADPRNETSGVVEATVRGMGVDYNFKGGLTVRKLTVRRAGWRAIKMGDAQPIVEDCRVYDSACGITVGDSSLLPIVRRCVIHDISGIALNAGNSLGARLYDNVVFSHNQDWARKRFWGDVAAFTIFAAQLARVYQNIVVQPKARDWPAGTGFWPDCTSPGHAWIGNAVYDGGTDRATAESGFYIESPAFGNVIQWNTCLNLNNGIALSVNRDNLVVENYCVSNHVALVLTGTQNSIPGTENNLFSRNWLQGNWHGLVMGPERGTNAQTRNYAQHNVYDTRGARRGTVARWPTGDYYTVDEFRRATGQETLGAEAEIDPAALGFVWVRVDDVDIRHAPIPLFGNPDCLKQDVMLYDGPWFWRRGDASGSDGQADGWTPEIAGPNPYGLFTQAPRSQRGITAWHGVAPVPGTPVGDMCLVVDTVQPKAGATNPAALGPEGLGWWSPSFPAAEGSTVDVVLWLDFANVQPTNAEGGVVVYVEWSDWTGQHKRRSYLVGGEGTVPAAHPELTRGTRSWSEVKGSVTAPKGARRMALFMGERSCTGRVYFDAIRTLATRPGEAPQASASVPPGAGPPLLDPATLTFFKVDVSSAFNRGLFDPQADDGQGGWADLGPHCGMEQLPTGDVEYRGVPFRLQGGERACVVLDSPRRPQSRLPKSVTLPVGRKADILYVVHSGAMLTHDKPNWRYRVRYADGESRPIDVVPGVNVRDYGEALNQEFMNPPGMRTTVGPDTCRNALSGCCGVFIMEWLNPRPQADIKDIEMVSGGEGVPILLAITGGVKK